MFVYCIRCGSELPGSAAFCPHCGEPVPATPMAAGASSPPVHTSAPVVTVPDIAPYAGFWRRFVAILLDGLILTFITFPINMVMRVPMFGWMSADQVGFDEIMTILTASLGAMILSTLVSWMYFAVLESSKLQGTLGKVALNIRVSDLAGGRISFGRASVRYFGRWLSNLTLCIGYLVQLFTRRRQALHDLVAGTLVVRRGPGE
jgi:uncharacterized RDD family membrane protein YckC